jgi:hypothetical protein
LDKKVEEEDASSGFLSKNLLQLLIAKAARSVGMIKYFFIVFNLLSSIKSLH